MFQDVSAALMIPNYYWFRIIPFFFNKKEEEDQLKSQPRK